MQNRCSICLGTPWQNFFISLFLCLTPAIEMCLKVQPCSSLTPVFFCQWSFLHTWSYLYRGDDFTVQQTTTPHPIFTSNWLQDGFIQMSCQRLELPACNRTQCFLFQTQFTFTFSSLWMWATLFASLTLPFYHHRRPQDSASRVSLWHQGFYFIFYWQNWISGSQQSTDC